MPETALVPLGTGNDLSRALGWGTHMQGKIDFPSILKKVNNSTPTFLDR